MLTRKLIFLLLTLSCTLLYGHANECRFDSVTSLESCRSTFWTETQDSCPSALPISGSITLAELFNSGNGIIRQRNWDYWADARDDRLDYWFDRAVRGYDTWEKFLIHLPGWNLTTVAAALLCLWIIVLPFLVLPLCCAACCGKKKLRKPFPLVVICFLALATCLTGIFTLYRATKETAYLHESLADIGCIIPRSTYAALYLKMEGSAGTYAGFSEFSRQLDIFDLELKDTSDYVAAMNAKSLLKFAVHGIYGPFLWTHKLLSKSTYNEWPTADTVTPGSITLNHTVLGYKALEAAGIITADEKTGPYAPVFAAIDAIQEPTWSKEEVSKALNSIRGYLSDSKTFINKFLSRFSDAVNDQVFRDGLHIDDAPILAPLYIITYLPIIGLMGGFGLFVLYMLRHDHEHSDRHVGRGRLATTGFFCFGFAAYGIFLMLISALILAAIRAGHAGCDFVDRGILTEGNLDGIATLTTSEQSVVDKCIKKGGDGNLVSAFFDLNSTDILNAFLSDSWSFDVSQGISFTDQQLELQQSDYLGYVLPIFDPSKAILAQTSTELFWATITHDTHTVDCAGPGNYYICEALKDLHSAGSGLEVTKYPWVNTNPQIIYGTKAGSQALTRIVSQTDCKGLTVCVDSDRSCNSNIRIGLSSVGYIPEDLVMNGVSKNWAEIIKHASRNDETRQVFSCFSNQSEDVQLAWVNGVRWTVLRDLISRKLTRPSTEVHNDQTATIDGYPGYFDVCPRTEACHVMATFTKNSDGNRVINDLSSPAIAMNQAKSALKIAYDAMDGNDVVKLVQQIALIANPMAKLRKSLDDLATNFNCAIIGDAINILHDRACPGLMGSGAHLATIWFAVSVVHVVAFIMTFLYWYRRKRATDEVPDSPREYRESDASSIIAS